MTMTEGLKEITLEEVAAHGQGEKPWMAIHGLVVELDKNLQNEHPGGPEVMLAIAGKDATEDFEDIGHSDVARTWANKLVIGRLSGSEAEKIPSMKDAHPAGEGGSSGGILLVVIAVAVAIIAYIMYA